MIVKRSHIVFFMILLGSAVILALVPLFLPSLPSTDVVAKKQFSPAFDASRPVEGLELAERAGTVRMIAANDVAPDQTSKPSPLAEYQHLGPLDGEDKDHVVSLCRRYRQMKHGRLSSLSDSDAQDPASLLEDAKHLHGAKFADAALDAFQKGSYVVTAQDAPSPPLSLPGIEILYLGATRYGEQVNVSIFMPLESYSELRAAREYLDNMIRFNDSEKAREFNSLPWDERKAIARRIQAIHAGDPTQTQMAFIRKTIGWHTRLDPKTGTVIVPPQQR